MREGEVGPATTGVGHIDVLVVDDDEASRDELTSSLDRAHISCLPAADGWSALRLLIEGCRPTLIVADIRMPELSGLEFAEQVRKLRGIGHPKLVLVSGHADFDDIVRALRLGVLDFLPKPIDLRRLVQVVRTLQLAVDAPLMPGEVETKVVTAPLSGSPSDRIEKILCQARALRRLRNRYLADDRLAEPAWEMVLELYKAHLAGMKLSVTNIGGVIDVPMTTALRRINDLERARIIIRTPDGRDRRRAIIELSPLGHRSVESFLEACGARISGETPLDT